MGRSSLQGAHLLLVGPWLVGRKPSIGGRGAMSMGSRIIANALCRVPSTGARRRGSQPPRRLMTVSSMGYGNMILYLPVLEALRERLPELRVLLLADRSTD